MTFRQTYNVGEILRAKEKVEEFRDDTTKSISEVKLNFNGMWLLTIEYKEMDANVKRAAPRRRE